MLYLSNGLRLMFQQLYDSYNHTLPDIIDFQYGNESSLSLYSIILL